MLFALENTSASCVRGPDLRFRIIEGMTGTALRLVGAREGLLQRLDQSGIVQSVSGQLRNGRLEFLASHNRQDTLHGFQFEKLFSADEKVVLRQQADKIEVELPGCRFHTETDIGHSAGHVGGDRSVRELDVLVAVDGGAIEAVLNQELFEQQASSGVRIAIHEPDGRIEQMSKRNDTERISPLHHQAHLASHQANHPMNSGYQPALAGGDASLSQFPLRKVYAGQIAPVVRKRYQRVLIRDIPEIHLEIFLPSEQFSQL